MQDGKIQLIVAYAWPYLIMENKKQTKKKKNCEMNYETVVLLFSVFMIFYMKFSHGLTFWLDITVDVNTNEC